MWNTNVWREWSFLCSWNNLFPAVDFLKLSKIFLSDLRCWRNLRSLWDLIVFCFPDLYLLTSFFSGGKEPSGETWSSINFMNFSYRFKLIHKYSLIYGNWCFGFFLFLFCYLFVKTSEVPEFGRLNSSFEKTPSNSVMADWRSSFSRWHLCCIYYGINVFDN